MRKLALGLFGLGVTSFLGCTAILGSFEVNPSTTANGDGSADANGSETSAGDAGADALNPADYLLTCGIDEQKIAAVDGSMLGYDKRPFEGFRIDNQRFRVVVRRGPSNQNGIPSFSIFTVQTPSGGSPQQQGTIDGPGTAGQVIDAIRIGNAIGVATFDIDTQSFKGILNLWVLADGKSTLDGPFQLANTIQMSASAQRAGGRIMALGANADDVFVALAFQQGTDIVWGAGRARNGQAPPTLTASSSVIQTFTQQNQGGKADLAGLLHAGGKMFVFDGAGPDNQTPNQGTTYYVIGDDNATIGGNAQPNTLTAPSKKATIAFGANGTPTTLTLAMGELDLSTGAPTPLILRAGGVKAPKLTNFTSTDFPEVASFTGLGDIPFSQAGGDGPPGFRFISQDDLFGIGPSIVSGAKGVNLLWYNVSLGVLRGKRDQKDPLLPSRAVQKMIAVPTANLAGAFADFDLVWSEGAQDGGSAATIYAGHLGCIKK